MSMYYRKKTPRVTGAARGFKGSGRTSRAAYVASLRAVPAAYTATRNRAPRRATVKGAIAPYGGRVELKYVDTASANYACDTTGSVTCLNLLAVGDDNTSRDGRQVTIKSVQIRGYLYPTDPNTAPHLCRVLLVWDNASNSGTIATVAQILESATSMAFPNVNNANRFTILHDHVIPQGTLQTTATQTYNAAVVPDLGFYKRIDQVTQYSGTTAAIGSIQNGALLLVTVGDMTSGSTNGSIATISARVRFTDN